MAEIRQLRYFVAVAERGSMSQAAVDLHLSQSALSETLRKLEVELGVDLLERSSRGVAPTPAGDALLVHARVAIESFDGAEGRAGPDRPTACRLRGGRRRPPLDPGPRPPDRPPPARGASSRGGSSGRRGRALREGNCDVAFVWLPADLAGLRLRSSPPSPASPGSRRTTGSLRTELRVDEPTTSRSWTCRAPRYWVIGAEPAPERRRRARWPRTTTPRRCRAGRRRFRLCDRPALDDRVLRAPTSPGSRSPTSTCCASRSPCASVTARR
jgi:DNA-binding transcriptional LysR family regulator